MPQELKSRGLYNGSLVAPPLRRIRQYLLEHQLVVLITDKNLGCAVAPQTWIIEKTTELLNSSKDYKLININEAVTLIKNKINSVRALAELADDSTRYGTSVQLPEFFQSQIREPFEENLRKLPKFYVIPKIHKSPIKARPIIPCHSVIQGPAAKFVSKMLKDIVKSKQGIIHGSKDLVLKLHSLKNSLAPLKFDNRVMKRLFIVSGDVVTFYPNIDCSKAHQIASDYLLEHRGSAIELDLKWVDKDAKEILMFRQVLSIANDNLLCQFDGKIFQQERGLAMGVSCSPDLANLYGCFFEERANIHSHPNVPFYGRFIDDCIGLVYALDEEDAKTFFSNTIVFDNCTIEWSASDSYMTFLDMTLYFDKDKVLQWKPFRKPLNHFEHIPWISAHPLYVKKGTFVSELSRIATLSSMYASYADVCREVADIYIARGYPLMLVASWLRHNYLACWDSRLKDNDKVAADVLVLKSEYNISWDYFNVQVLSERLKSGWIEAIRTLSFGKMPADLHASIATTKPKLAGSSLTQTKREDLFRTFSEDWVEEGLFGQYLRLDKLGLLDRRVLVSKKKTRQLIDLTSLWRRVVLEGRDHQVVKQLEGLQPSTLDWWILRKETKEAKEPVVVPGYIE